MEEHLPSYDMASDIDGDKHVIVLDSEQSMDGWKIRIRKTGFGKMLGIDLELDPAGAVELASFYKDVAYIDGGQHGTTNLIGMGTPVPAWLAFCDWGYELLGFVPPQDLEM